ncbi:MAG TPA: hypothetical protein VKB93_03730 [Thermoanaerobaculia bacterium]|nr:hypothetical protein [Thermoanaerobaculia bacterium]
MNSKLLAVGLIVVVVLLIVLGERAFHREYAVPGDGLIDVKALETRHGTFLITGSLRGSGGKITKTTVSRDGPTVMLRVYAAPIQPDDRPEDCVGAFSVTLPKDGGIDTIAVGEDPDWADAWTNC